MEKTYNFFMLKLHNSVFTTEKGPFETFLSCSDVFAELLHCLGYWWIFKIWEERHFASLIIP